MDPVTGAMIVGSGLQLMGSGKQASAQRKSGRANARVLRENAAVRRIMARDALQRGDTAEAQQRMDVAAIKSDQKARMLAGGQALTGSNSRILDDTDFYGELDALTIRRNAQMEAWQLNKQADIDLLNADAAAAGGGTSANATILGGAAQVAGNWFNYANG